MAKKTRVVKGAKPGEPDLAEQLGSAKRHWDALLARVRQDHSDAVAEWKFYKTAGWRCVVRNARRNLAYLGPGEGGFLASFALSAAAHEAAGKEKLPTEVTEAMKAAQKLPEGYAVRFTVSSAATAAAAARLLALNAG